MVKTVEVIEDSPQQLPVMLSLPASAENMGLAVAISSSGLFGAAIPLQSFTDRVRSTAPEATSWTVVVTDLGCSGSLIALSLVHC